MMRFFTFVVSSFFLFLTSVDNVAAKSPNFLVILCDDLGYGDLECYGHPIIKTPHLNRLAKQGIRFTDCYSSSPVCSPSRAGLLTGKTPNRTGIYDWIPEGHPMHLKEKTPTIATLLSDAGYETGVVGKWHCNGEFNSPNQPQPGENGFQHWFATQNNAKPRHKNPINFVRNSEPVGNLEGFSCQLVTDEAIRFMNANQKTEKPFFLHVCFHEPHEPVESPTELVNQYEKLARNENEAQYFANVANVDLAVGRLMKSLDDLHLSEETLVIFTSDNGPETLLRYGKSSRRSYGSPGKMRGMKLHIYEGGIRVAGLMRWKGKIAANQTISEPVYSLDFLPSFCELAGVKLPENIKLDGHSLVRIIEGKSLERTKPLFWHYYRSLTNPKVAMRDGDWKIVGIWDGPGTIKEINQLGRGVNSVTQKMIKKAKLIDFELYNLKKDPSETTNLSAKHPAEFDRLKQLMIKQYEEVQRECPVWETEKYWKQRSQSKRKTKKK